MKGKRGGKKYFKTGKKPSNDDDEAAANPELETDEDGDSGGRIRLFYDKCQRKEHQECATQGTRHSMVVLTLARILLNPYYVVCMLV